MLQNEHSQINVVDTEMWEQRLYEYEEAQLLSAIQDVFPPAHVYDTDELDTISIEEWEEETQAEYEATSFYEDLYEVSEDEYGEIF